MKQFFFFIILVWLTQAHAQHQLDWVNAPFIEKGVSCYMDDILVDEAGNTYTFQNRHSGFDPSFSNPPIRRKLIVKQDATGNVVWQKQIGNRWLPEFNLQNLLVRRNNKLYTVIYEDNFINILRINEQTGEVDTVVREQAVSAFEANYNAEIFTGYNGHIYTSLQVYDTYSYNALYEINATDSLEHVYTLTAPGLMAANNYAVDKAGNVYTTYTTRLNSISYIHYRRTLADGNVLADSVLFTLTQSGSPDFFLALDSFGNSFWTSGSAIFKLDTAMNKVWLANTPATRPLKNLVDKAGNFVSITNLPAGGANLRCLKLNGTTGATVYNYLIPTAQYGYDLDLHLSANNDAWITSFDFIGLDDNNYKIYQEGIYLTILDTAGQVKELFADTIFYYLFADVPVFRSYVSANGDVYIATTFYNPHMPTTQINDPAQLTAKIDVWYTIKLCQRCGNSNVKGRVFIDTLANCQFDSLEPPATNTLVQLQPDNRLVTPNNKGEYRFKNVDAGNYTLAIAPPPYLSPACDSVYAFTIDTTTPTANYNFALTPRPGCQMFVLLSGTRARAGFQQCTNVLYYNETANPLSGYVAVTLDAVFTFTHASVVPDSVSGRTYFWKFSNLPPYQTKAISIFSTTAITNTAAFLSFSNIATVTANCAGSSSVLATDSLSEQVFTSFDPNDKTVSPLLVRQHNQFINKDEALEFQINFQNTGNDTAFRIALRDTIDTNFDLSTLRMIAASHPYQFESGTNRNLQWTFENILLPDSHTNEPLSHGYVRYSIKPAEHLQYNDYVYNTAHIYFDFNDPVVTNTVSLQYVLRFSSVAEADGFNVPFKVYPNPAHGYVTVNRQGGNMLGVTTALYNITGLAIPATIINHTNEIRIDMGELPAGIYFIHLQQAENKTNNFIKVVKY